MITGIYLIFTKAGYENAKESIIANKAAIWSNAEILVDNQQNELAQNGVTINILAQSIDPSNEKEILAAIEAIEIEHPDSELFVEYQ